MLNCRKRKVSTRATKKGTPLTTRPADDGTVLATEAGPALGDVAQIERYSSPRYQNNPVNEGVDVRGEESTVLIRAQLPFCTDQRGNMRRGRDGMEGQGRLTLCAALDR